MVQADAMRNSFIQTLTKTFADLATGLAVFDRTRRLVLFNPALVDLTGLSAEFLSAVPPCWTFSTSSNRQVLPEPQELRFMARQINDMIETAVGRTLLRSMDPAHRPDLPRHRPAAPDGAVAFLIEDITDECR